MSWIRKARGARQGYFYRSVRDGDQVRKVYLGRGPKAAEAAQEIEQRRQSQIALREDWLREKSKTAAPEQCLAEARMIVNVLYRTVLLLAGFHEHRGQWRKRRKGKDVK